MLSRQTIDRIIDLGLELGSDFVEVYQEDTRHNNITALHDRVESSSCGREQGVGLRIFSGLNSRYAYTTATRGNLIRLMRKWSKPKVPGYESPQGSDCLRR